MPNDINELDVNDIGLKEIFGNRFHDYGDVRPVATETTEASYNTAPTVKVARSPIEDSVDAEWYPDRPAPNFYDKLKRCAKSVAVFGGLNILVFYWQNSGLMADSIALPCMIVCAVLAGFGVGKAFGGK